MTENEPRRFNDGLPWTEEDDRLFWEGDPVAELPVLDPPVVVYRCVRYTRVEYVVRDARAAPGGPIACDDFERIAAEVRRSAMALNPGVVTTEDEAMTTDQATTRCGPESLYHFVGQLVAHLHGHLPRYAVTVPPPTMCERMEEVFESIRRQPAARVELMPDAPQPLPVERIGELVKVAAALADAYCRLGVQWPAGEPG